MSTEQHPEATERTLDATPAVAHATGVVVKKFAARVGPRAARVRFVINLAYILLSTKDRSTTTALRREMTGKLDYRDMMSPVMTNSMARHPLTCSLVKFIKLQLRWRVHTLDDQSHRTSIKTINKEVVAEYIEAFFRFVYPVGCMSFLHQATFLRQWHTYTVNLSLLKVVCGSALRVFSTTQEDNERATQWMREAELDALQNLDDLTIPRLQALTLLAFFEFNYHVHSKKALMLLGLASRLAFAKRLNHEDPSLSVVEQESRRRLMWSVFVLDKFCSGGVGELTLVPAEYMEIRLPTIEKAFGFAKRVTSSDESLYLSAQELFALDSDIDAIEQQIPDDLKWDKAHLQKRIYAPGLSGYIMLHTWRLQCKLDLHRLTVSGTKECVSETALQSTPMNFSQNLRLKCLSHAIELTKMWAEVLDLGLAKPVHDPAIAGCAHQCAKILTLIPEQVGYSAPGQENRVGAVLVCQMILDPLKDIYPKAKILVSDFSASQRHVTDFKQYDDVCRMRTELNTLSAQDHSTAMQHNGTGGHGVDIAIQANDEDQVRNLLNQYNS
ncbi:hypothetical protein D6D22_09277 [Aureobasidium pullulans]|uniref:Xylanolytic transcriptional activator regulatory domain-containing protein n=1 Tax=Aureobasidium pullulans TaxID=5580 RepID=A0A4S8X444_AURPU|nr:hypothetical protein D6D22_09277 [Aureobasidium pullulans]